MQLQYNCFGLISMKPLFCKCRNGDINFEDDNEDSEGGRVAFLQKNRRKTAILSFNCSDSVSIV